MTTRLILRKNFPSPTHPYIASCIEDVTALGKQVARLFRKSGLETCEQSKHVSREVRKKLGPLLGHEQSNTTDIYVRTAQLLTVEAFDRVH